MEHPLLQKVRGLLRHLEVIKVLDTLSDIEKSKVVQGVILYPLF